MDELDLIKHLPGEDQPPRPEARAAARAALVECFEDEGDATAKPARRRPGWLPRLAFAGAAAAAAAALLIAFGTGSPGGKPTFAAAAELERLARLAPHLQIAGGWQITDVSAGQASGATRFHYERTPGSFIDSDAEIRWSAASLEQLGRRLERRGLEATGPMPVRTLDVRELRAGDFLHMTSSALARTYASPHRGNGFFAVVGLWSRGPWSFELRARVTRLDMLERLLERIEVLRREEWLVAIRPGGAEWLAHSMDGTAQRLENVEVKLPSGRVVYQTTVIETEPGAPAPRDFASPLPVITRKGDKVAVTFERPPAPGPAPHRETPRRAPTK